MTDIPAPGIPHVAQPTSADAVARLVGRIERLPITGLQVRARVIIGTATFFDAFDSLAIAYVLPVLVPMWKLTPVDTGTLIASGFIGQLLGTLLFGWIAEKWGRKSSVNLSIAVFSIFSLLCAFAPSYQWLLLCRILQGLGIGGEVPVAAAYISEIAKAHGRGFFVLIYEMAFGVGLFLVSVLGRFMVPAVGWQGMFIIGAVPALVTVFITRFVPESPRWLASKGRFTEADQIVSEMEKEASKGGKVQLAPVVVSPSVALKPTRIGELLEGIYKKRTLTLWVIWMTTYFASNGLNTWLPTIYTTFYKLPLETALTYSMITAFFNFLGALLPAFIIDRVGRKPMIQYALMLGGLELVILWLTGAQDPTIVVVFASLGLLTFATVACALFVYSPENYPTRMRAAGSSYASAWQKLASASGPFILGWIIPLFGVSSAFLMFGIVLLFGGVITYMFATETAGRVLEEVSP